MKAIDRAISVVGGQQKFAAALDVKYQAIQKWRRNSVPADRCLAIESITGGEVTRYDLRPDVFGTAPIADKAA